MSQISGPSGINSFHQFSPISPAPGLLEGKKEVQVVDIKEVIY